VIRPLCPSAGTSRVPYHFLNEHQHSSGIHETTPMFVRFSTGLPQFPPA
jgi:hypothetical protein